MELINAHELSVQLRVSQSTVRRWTRLRKIPHIRVDKKFVRYNADAVLAALDIAVDHKRNGGCA